MNLITNRFLFRIAYPCLFIAEVPHEGDDLLDLPDSCRIDNFADMDGRRNFADVRLAADFERMRVTTREEQRLLLQRVRSEL